MLEKPIEAGSRARGFIERRSYEFLLPVEFGMHWMPTVFLKQSATCLFAMG